MDNHSNCIASRTPASGFRGAIRKWLGKASVRGELGALADRDLRELGMTHRDIARTVDREIGKLRADEFRSRG